MCRSSVTPAAAPLVADLLKQIAAKLARECGCDPGEVRIGPVDFGDESEAT